MKKYFLVATLIFITKIIVAQDSSKPGITLNSFEELKLYGTLWQQTAAEYRALCYQAFNTATMRLNEIPKRKFRKEKLAIITDLDETILDNSYLEGQLMKDHKTYTDEAWKAWTDLSAATEVPGAVKFLQYAKQKGATIFYVSNRNVNEVASTVINIKKLQLPDADSSHTLFLSTTSSKEERRQKIMNNYTVVMLLGDNLNDFAQVFEKKNINDRFTATDNAKDDWGKKFIVLPNATYGEWEGAWYNYNYALPPQQRLYMLRIILKGISTMQ